jgi:sugar-specific transcriptional regulator TrmB
MENSLATSLQRIGFTANEAGVYVALLELGRGTVAKIAERAGINRTTGYNLLSTLVQRGMVSSSGKGARQEYVAESPDRLVSYMKKEAEDLVANLSAASSLVPQLKSIHNVSERPKVRFYEGKEGLESVYEDTLTSSEPIRAYAAVDDMHKTLPDYFSKYYQRRVKEGIAIRAIIPATETGKDRAEKDKAEMRETALVPPGQFSFTPEINIYDNKVMIASWREKLGIIIESAEIADAMKKIYELSWAEAKRLSEEVV